MSQKGTLRQYNDAWRKRWDDVNIAVARIKLANSGGKGDGNKDGKESGEDNDDPQRSEVDSHRSQLCPSGDPSTDVR